jgi:hypothetical protein
MLAFATVGALLGGLSTLGRKRLRWLLDRVRLVLAAAIALVMLAIHLRHGVLGVTPGQEAILLLFLPLLLKTTEFVLTRRTRNLTGGQA